VCRTDDAEEFKDIKRGGWTLDQVKAEAERSFEGIERSKCIAPVSWTSGRLGHPALRVSVRQTEIDIWVADVKVER